VEKQEKNHRRLRFAVAIVGFVLVPLELSLALYEVASYQSLVCSIYLLLNILLELSAWTERYRLKYGRKIGYAERRLILGVILVPSWLLFNWLIGLIAPGFSYVTIWSLSFAAILLLVLPVSIHGFVAEKRKSEAANEIAQKTFVTARKRKRYRRASVRTVIFLSPLIVLAGSFLAYLGWFTSIFHTELGLLQAQVTAFGVTLMFMGVSLPIVRILQERSRRLKRARKAMQETKLAEPSV
jgi:hypothetical protein